MVPGSLDRGAGNQPQDKSDQGADDRCDDADDEAVCPHDELDVPCRGTVRGEQAERAQATLREYGEAADRDERDEHHPEHRDHGNDGLGVDHIVRLTTWERLRTFGPIEPGETPGASKSSSVSLGERTWPGSTSANSSRVSRGSSTTPTTLRVTPASVQLDPMRRLNADATSCGHRDFAGRARVAAGNERQ